MRFAIDTPNFGIYSDPRMMAELARDADEAGWDGFFIWDHFFWTAPQNQPVADPYVLLAAMAMASERLKLGALITPIARRRPWKLAREVATPRPPYGRAYGPGRWNRWRLVRRLRHLR